MNFTEIRILLSPPPLRRRRFTDVMRGSYIRIYDPRQRRKCNYILLLDLCNTYIRVFVYVLIIYILHYCCHCHRTLHYYIHYAYYTQYTFVRPLQDSFTNLLLPRYVFETIMVTRTARIMQFVRGAHMLRIVLDLLFLRPLFLPIAKSTVLHARGSRICIVCSSSDTSSVLPRFVCTAT